MMEITSGIQENEKIITNPSDKTMEGKKAQIINTNKKADEVKKVNDVK